MADKAKFIGIAALETIANKILPQVIMGPAYSSPEELERLGIHVVSGVRFKHTYTSQSCGRNGKQYYWLP